MVAAHNQSFLLAPLGAVNEPAPAALRLLLDIIDTVRGPLLVLDAEFRVQQANRAFFRTFQVEPEDTLGQVLFSLGDGQWDVAPLHDLLRDKLPVTRQLDDYEVDHLFPVIGHKIMLLNTRLVSQGPGLPRVILLAIEDITDRRLAERHLETQRHELERSNAALDEYASIASHDLQEPLRKILSFGELLSASASATLSTQSLQYLERMQNAAIRMRSLISDLLTISQVTSRVHTFRSTDLARTVRDVVVDLETVVNDAAATVDIGPLPVIEADPVQMRQLMQNLLGNAIKYRRKDTPPVVRVRSEDADDGNCRITVSDNGIGFKDEHAERIFRMFERLHGRTRYEGSGMGLAICRKIVERHGGAISATSDAGVGSTFTITLPLTQSVARHLS